MRLSDHGHDQRRGQGHRLGGPLRNQLQMYFYKRSDISFGFVSLDLECQKT